MSRSDPAGRRAVFLDRDGTIIEDVAYLREASQVRLLPGAAAAIRRLNSAGVLAIVVTNQSGIARGLLTVDQYRLGQRRLERLLADQDARIDADYFCPHLPEITGPCECRKPGTLLYRQAAERFDIDLRRSWWVGDRIRDVAPAEVFDAQGVLIRSGTVEQPAGNPASARIMQAGDLDQAVDLVLKLSLPSPP